MAARRGSQVSPQRPDNAVPRVPFVPGREAFPTTARWRRPEPPAARSSTIPRLDHEEGLRPPPPPGRHSLRATAPELRRPPPRRRLRVDPSSQRELGDQCSTVKSPARRESPVDQSLGIVPLTSLGRRLISRLTRSWLKPLIRTSASAAQAWPSRVLSAGTPCEKCIGSLASAPKRGNGHPMRWAPPQLRQYRRPTRRPYSAGHGPIEALRRLQRGDRLLSRRSALLERFRGGFHRTTEPGTVCRTHSPPGDIHLLAQPINSGRHTRSISLKPSRCTLPSKAFACATRPMAASRRSVGISAPVGSVARTRVWISAKS